MGNCSTCDVDCFYCIERKETKFDIINQINNPINKKEEINFNQIQQSEFTLISTTKRLKNDEITSLHTIDDNTLRKKINEIHDKNLNECNHRKNISLQMPKFKLEFKYDMKKILEDMGMKKAFTKEAEFNNISEKMKLFVNQVLQKNYINVNEEGTQACSITELEVVLECYVVKAENAKDFIANRPFIFILRDGECPKGHDIILFTKICRFNQKE